MADADFFNLNLEAALFILLAVNVFCTMCIAVAFILLARWLLKPTQETLIYAAGGELEDELANLDTENARHETTPVLYPSDYNPQEVL